MKVLISAAEASSDVHGAELLKALRATAPTGESIEAFGIGGPKLKAAGLRIVFDAADLLAMGLFSVILRLPKILTALRKIGEDADRERPDLAVVIDYPDFHFRLARTLKCLQVPVVYFIPPKVWVWRQRRVKFLGKFFSRILCILPFEEGFYRRRGVEARFVGNPIVDELPFQLTQPEARAALGLKGDSPVVVLMPGSRPAEVSAHFEIMLNATLRTAMRMGQSLTVLVPFPQTSELDGPTRRVESWRRKTGENRAKSLQIRLSKGDAHTCLVAADAGLIKSGTSTLEAALLACPHAILYRGSRFVSWVFKKLIRYRGPVGLANLAALKDPPGEAERRKLPFREFLMEEARSDLLGEELLALLGNPERRQEILSVCADLKTKLLGEAGSAAGSDGPSFRAAREIWALHQELKQKKLEQSSVPAPELARAEATPLPAQAMSCLVSWAWSFVNSMMRLLSAKGFLKPVRLGARVISVGNIQAGGSGKTPLVAQIAREAVAHGKKVAILTRGYQGSWERSGGVIRPGEKNLSALDCGDEASLLHDLVPEAWIGVGADRVAQYREIQKISGSPLELVILDDGFQNWKIRKDVDVVAVTSSERSERLFRDFGGALRYADLVVWTKGDAWQFPTNPMDVRIRYRLAAPKTESPFVLVTGVGDSASVLRDVRATGYLILRHLSFPDHARYAEPMVRLILKDAAEAGAKILTTGKDWVKWRKFLSPEETARVEVIEPELIFEEGRERWSKLLWGN